MTPPRPGIILLFIEVILEIVFCVFANEMNNKILNELGCEYVKCKNKSCNILKESLGAPHPTIEINDLKDFLKTLMVVVLYDDVHFQHIIHTLLMINLIVFNRIKIKPYDLLIVIMPELVDTVLLLHAILYNWIKYNQKWHLSEDVCGATLMAAGTSSPELLTAIIGTFLYPDDNAGASTNCASPVFHVCIGLSIIYSGKQDSKFLLPFPFVRDCTLYALSLVFIFIFVDVTGVRIMSAVESFMLIFVWIIYTTYEDEQIISFFQQRLRLNCFNIDINNLNTNSALEQPLSKSDDNNEMTETPVHFKIDAASVSNINININSMKFMNSIHKDSNSHSNAHSNTNTNTIRSGYIKATRTFTNGINFSNTMSRTTTNESDNFLSVNSIISSNLIKKITIAVYLLLLNH